MNTNKAQHGRFKDAPWYMGTQVSGNRAVMLGGAGGIGSWTALLLARAGFFPLIYDFDKLEEHNLGGQIFSKQSVGKPKVVALVDLIKDLCDEEVIGLEQKIDEGSYTHIHCIAAFDNMVARRDMFTTWKKQYGSNPQAIFIDGRLNAEQMQIFCIKGGSTSEIIGHQDLYEKDHLFNDSEVEDAPCTMKQTSHAAAMIAAYIVGFFTNHIANIVDGDDGRTIPFKMEYFIPLNLFEVEE